MKIKVSELRSFKSNASFIKTNTLLPVLSYLKFSDGIITKNNLHSFLIQKMSPFKESFLVDEKILMNFIDCTAEEEIEIKIKDKRIWITDGNTKVTSSTEDVINFPPLPEGGDDQVAFTKDILTSIKTASNFLSHNENEPFRSHLFIGKKAICASNGFVAYVEQFEVEIPEIILSKENAQIVSKLDNAFFYQNGNYHFFESGNVKYGFIKPAVNFFDLTKFSVYSKDKFFTVNKNDIIRFNDIAMSSTPSKTVTSIFGVVNNVMTLNLQDIDFEVTVTKEIPVEGEMEGDFRFMPLNMNQILKNIPSDDLTFYQAKNKFYITGKEGFTTLLMGVVNEN